MPPRAYVLRIELPPPGASSPADQAVVTFHVPLPTAGVDAVEMPVKVSHVRASAANAVERVYLEAQYALREHLLEIAKGLPARPESGPPKPPIGMTPSSP